MLPATASTCLIGILRGGKPPPQRASTLNRTDAFCETAQAVGLQVTRTLEGEVHHAVTAQEMANFAETGTQSPIAAVCWMEISVYILLDYCEGVRLRVPEELAIVGSMGCCALG